MNDLVQRLHTAGREVPTSGGLLHEAADRIEQLERENAELQSKLEKAGHDLFCRRQYMSNALNREMKLKNPEWDMVEVKLSQSSQDIRTGQTKVVFTLIFESNGWGLA